MSLQIWLPLDGNLENKGCYKGDFTIVTSPTYIDNGKIGKALSGGQIKISADATASILNNDAFSFCCWVYVNAETGDTTNRATFFGNESMEELNNRKFTIFQYPSCNDLHLSWMNDETSTFTGGRWDGVFPSYKWTHVAVTYQNPTIKIYINGVLLDTKTGVSNSSTFAYETTLFKNAPNSSKYINDYRIYNSCLSQAEVNEIAQGLVVHYKLSPYLNWLDDVKEKSLKRKSGNDFIDYTYDSRLISCTDTKYTIDFDAKGTADDMKIDIYFRNSTGNSYACTPQQTLTTDWKHYTLTINGSPENLVLFRVRLYAGTENDIIYLKHLKLVSDNMPYVNNYVVDSSGYGRHGKVEGTIQFSADSPKYNNSYIMDGLTTNLIHYDEEIFNYGENDDFSYSLWVKPNHTGDPSQYIFTNGRADYGEYGYGLHNNSDTSLRFRYGSKYYDMSIIKNEWVHTAFTKSGNTLKTYKNGEIYNTYTFDGTYPTYGDGKGLGLGNFHYTNEIYPAYGNISDFRIYCTALSDETIKNLYNTSLKIDKNGKSHTLELIENSSLNITKSGKLISHSIFESDYNFYEGGDISYKPENRINSTCPYNGIVNLSSVADLGLPISLNIEADFSWENFTFDTSVTTPFLQTQGDSRLKSDNTFTWTNGINSNLRLENYVSTSTSGLVHISGVKTIAAEKFNTMNGFHFGMRCDYSDGNGTLSLSNIKITLADDKTKFTKSYILANEFIEK